MHKQVKALSKKQSIMGEGSHTHTLHKDLRGSSQKKKTNRLHAEQTAFLSPLISPASVSFKEQQRLRWMREILDVSRHKVTWGST